jgi:hypothetical protein
MVALFVFTPGARGALPPDEEIILSLEWVNVLLVQDYKEFIVSREKLFPGPEIQLQYLSCKRTGYSW